MYFAFSDLDREKNTWEGRLMAEKRHRAFEGYNTNEVDFV